MTDFGAGTQISGSGSGQGLLERRLEGDDALIPCRRRAQLDGRWAVARADVRPYASAARAAP